VRRDRRGGSKRGKAWPPWVSVLSVVLTTAMFALMIVQTISQVRRERPEITAFVLESLELTQFPEHPDLVGEFYFDKNLVEHLYRIGIEIVNTGNATIIGEGAHKMIVGEALPLHFPEGATILDLNTIDPTGLSQGVSNEGASISVHFKQWRQSERLTIRAYVSAAKRAEEPFLPYVDEREIEKGLFRVVDRCGLQQSAPSSLLMRFPDAIRVLILIAAAVSGIYWGTVAGYHLYLTLFTRHGSHASTQQLLLFETGNIGPFGGSGARDEVAPRRRRQVWLIVVAALRIAAAACPLLYLALALLP
jgi:hypothetical protein